MCVLCLAGWGGPASRARSGAPHLFLSPLCLSVLRGPLQAGVALLSLAAVAVPRCLGAVFWLLFTASRCLALRALSPRLCPPLGRWLLSGAGPPPPPLPSCVSRFSSTCLLPWCFFFFFLCAPPLSLAFSGFRPRVPWASALCLFALLAFRFSALRALFPLLCFPPGCWLLPGGCRPAPPPPPLCLAVFVAAAWCCAPCAVLCCVFLGASLRRAAARCVARGCAVVCCVALLRSFVAAACRAVPSGAPRRPGALCSAALCFAVFPRAVCVLSWRGGACCCSPLCFVLCVSRGAVLCVPCPLRSVRCCASLCWCARVVLFVWCCGALLCVVLFPLVCRGAVLGLVARGCLLVACFGVGVPVWPRGLLPCGWCGFLWCPAFLCRVLWCCAVAWCCAVSLCCRVAVLLGLALPSCGLSCFAVLCCWLAVLFFCPVVVSACCGALSLVLCDPCLVRSVRCGALLCWLWCRASLCRALWRCAVVWCCAVVLCCRFAVLFVFPLPSCGLSCGAVLCCVVLLVVCAVFCPMVAFVCCGALSLPAGTHKKTSIILHVTPRWWRCRGWLALVVAVSWT